MNFLPNEIEIESFSIITRELGPCSLKESELAVLKRVIHTTADFEYKDNLLFSQTAVETGLALLRSHCTIVTDTNMGLAGINKSALAALGCQTICFMQDPIVGQEARERGTTRACVSMEHAVKLPGKVIYAIGNAPTALLRLRELMDVSNIGLLIAVPVGFVNVTEAKEDWVNSHIPHIIARGRKGGSNVAAAIVNSLLYQLIQREGF